MPPSHEDFDQWLESPVTRYVMRACKAAAEGNKAAAIEAVWGQGIIDPVELAQLRTRADAYMALTETTLADWRAINGDDDE